MSSNLTVWLKFTSDRPCCHGNENLGIGIAIYGLLGLAYVDLCAAFDSVDRNALWLLLRRLGIPPKLVDMFEDLYTCRSAPLI